MWRIIRGTLLVIGLALSVTGLMVFLATGCGVWWLKKEANQRADELAGKAHKAVDTADRGVTFVREVIDQAEADLKHAKQMAKGEPPVSVNPFVQLSARHTSERLAGSVERANTAVVNASEAIVVAKSALEVFGKDEELQSWFRVQPQHIEQTRTNLSTASREMSTVRSILGIPFTDQAAPTNEQLLTVESALVQARDFTNQMGDTVANARKQVNETKQQVDTWVLRTAVGVSSVCVLAALGQFFMIRFCWRALWGKPA